MTHIISFEDVIEGRLTEISYVIHKWTLQEVEVRGRHSASSTSNLSGNMLDEVNVERCVLLFVTGLQEEDLVEECLLLLIVLCSSVNLKHLFLDAREILWVILFRRSFVFLSIVSVSAVAVMTSRIFAAFLSLFCSSMSTAVLLFQSCFQCSSF